MKKLIAILTAALMLLAAVPTLAFTGFDEAPAMPEIAYASEEFFPASVTRMENEPEETQNQFGETVRTWVPYTGDANYVPVGEVVTYACEIEVPETLEGFSEEALESIEALFDFEGFESLELVEAMGADPNYECDYELGFCYPLPGYGNVSLVGSCLEIDARLSSHVTAIVQGIAASERIACTHTVTVGQYKLPAHFSIGKLSYEDGCYFIYYKDTDSVQMRGMKFYEVDGVFDHYTVYYNNHDYERDLDGGDAVYNEVGNDEEFIFDGELYDTLEFAYNTVMRFFGFADDGMKDALTDSVFLYGSSPVRFEKHFELCSDFVAGDANYDGLVNTEDALIVLRAALGISGSHEELLLNCDMDDNGVIDTTDALIVLRMALGIGN